MGRARLRTCKYRDSTTRQGGRYEYFDSQMMPILHTYIARMAQSKSFQISLGCGMGSDSSENLNRASNVSLAVFFSFRVMSLIFLDTTPYRNMPQC